MGLEGNSLTIASHSVMVVILIALITRSLRTFQRGLGSEAVEHGLMVVIAICASGIIIERLYYITARFLRPIGINLWAMHPAPEALSLVGGVGFYAIMVPMIRAQRSPRATIVRVSSEWLGLVVLWFLVIWILY